MQILPCKNIFNFTHIIAYNTHIFKLKLYTVYTLHCTQFKLNIPYWFFYDLICKCELFSIVLWTIYYT